MKLNLSIDELREALESTADEQGRVTRKGVVDAVRRDRNHKLRPAFNNFDVKAAAEQHWLEVAGQLIRRVPIYRINEEKLAYRAPFYVHVPNREGTPPREEPGYVALGTVERASEEAELITSAELRRAVGAIKRALRIADALDSHTRTGLVQLLSSAETLLAELPLRAVA